MPSRNTDAVGNLEDFFEMVGDVDDGQALRLELAQTVEQPGSLLQGEREVGSSSTSTLALRANALMISTICWLPIDSLPTWGRPEVHTKPVQQLLRGPLHRPLVDQAERSEGLATGKDVFGNGQVGDQAQLLEHHADAGSFGFVRC